MPRALRTLLIDAVLVIVFCIIGRLSHSEGVFTDPLGLVHTIWPFLVAVSVAHVVLRASRLSTERMPAGTAIWVITVAGGLGLRAVSAQGVALPFVLVATITLGVFLLGWRALGGWARRRGERRASRAPSIRR